MITDAIIQSSGLDPKDIPLKFGAYVGDSDIVEGPMTVSLADYCSVRRPLLCTRPAGHKGLHIAHGIDQPIHLRWK